MYKKIILALFTLLFINPNLKIIASENVFIAYKVNEEIITNVDIENEARYLVALNNQLKNLTNEKILEIATDSIIKETIKKIEVIKYFKLDQQNSFLDKVIEDFYTKLKLKNLDEFKNYLINYNITINDIKKKVEIETTWNRVIYTKYVKQINVNTEALKKRINFAKKTEDKKLYLFSEIVFEKNKDEALIQKIKKINESIEEIGFKNTANIYSIADSAKFGGAIDWVEEGKLNKELVIQIGRLDVGEITEPIRIGNGFLILKIENIRTEKIKIDEKKELEKMIEFERNKQLEQFSKIYFNKIKINTAISEL